MRGLLAGEYYHDVDMVNSLPNVAKQLHKLGMTSEANVRSCGACTSQRGSAVLERSTAGASVQRVSIKSIKSS